MSNIFDSLAAAGNKPEDDPSISKAVAANDVQANADPSDFANESAGPTTPPAVKHLTQHLLRNGYLEEARKGELFRQTVLHQSKIETALEPLDLELKIDSHRGVAYLAVAAVEMVGDANQAADYAWSHPLVRRQRLTLEQSLLLAILRQAFVMHEQEAGVGQSVAKVSVDELLPQFLTFFEDSGSDGKNESRLMNVLEHLKTHGVVSEVDKQQEVTIRPMIAHLANPQSLTALLKTLQEVATNDSTNDPPNEVTSDG